MDFNYLITIVIYIFGYNIKKRYKIYKDFNKIEKIKISKPNTLKAVLEKEDIIRLKNIKLGNNILYFKNKLENYINNCCFYIMRTNLKTIKAKECYILLENLLLKPVGGAYLPTKNKIKCLKFFKEDVLNHELFHMASSTYNNIDKIYLCGFAQYNEYFNKRFGVALNEGYTELLTERYFGKNSGISKIYKLCEFYSKKLEEIIGKEKMTELYLNADLSNLISQLKKYDSKENIINFINSLDFIFKHISSLSNPIIIGKNKFKENITSKLAIINNSLIKWYIKRKHNELKENQITSNTFINSINEYYNSIINYTLFDRSSNVPIKQFTYKTLDKLDIPTKEAEKYKQVKIIKKRYNH